jgi:hypothetical protein
MHNEIMLPKFHLYTTVLQSVIQCGARRIWVDEKVPQYHAWEGAVDSVNQLHHIFQVIKYSMYPKVCDVHQQRIL